MIANTQSAVARAFCGATSERLLVVIVLRCEEGDTLKRSHHGQRSLGIWALHFFFKAIEARLSTKTTSDTGAAG